MAITDPYSVLLLGAGTSVPHGLGLGGDLIKQVENAIRSELDVRGSGYQRSIAVRETMSTARHFHKYPILGAIANKHSLDFAMSEGLNNLRKLAELLKNQTSETIDDFIVQNPSYSEIVKIVIAALFVSASYTLETNNSWLKVKSFEERQSQQQIRYFNERAKQLFRRERNWIHLLINIVRHGIKEGRISKNNKVKIITFNYDCILEYVLKKQFGNIEDPIGIYADYEDYIEIIHVHGKCGLLEDIIYNPSEVIIKWASGIWVVNEDNISNEVKEARQKACDIITNSRQIYAVGFSFSGPNCRLIKVMNVSQSISKRTIHYCNYDGNLGLELMVNNLAKRRIIVEPQKGSYERPLSVVDWFRVGHVGEMPG